MPLPSIRTINERLQHIKFLPGILSEVIEILPLKIQLMESGDEECMLCFDEVALEKHLGFDRNSMTTVGYGTAPFQVHVLDFQEMKKNVWVMIQKRLNKKKKRAVRLPYMSSLKKPWFLFWVDFVLGGSRR